MVVIPAIDLLGGQVVRLQQGSYDDVTLYNEDPLDEAMKFNRAGFSHIHIVDLDGAREGSFKNLDHIKKIKKETTLSVQTGGGVRDYEDAQKLLLAGISRVICGSMAIQNKKDWLQLLNESAAQMVLGMDLKEGKIAYGGWLETADDSIEAFLEPMIDAGLRHVLCTDISRDGTLEGVNVDLYEGLQDSYPSLNFIASGGVASYKDLRKLAKTKVWGVVVGRAYYEGEITLEQMREFNQRN